MSANSISISGNQRHFARAMTQYATRRQLGRRSRLTNTSRAYKRVYSSALDNIALVANSHQRTICSPLYPSHRLNAVHLPWQIVQHVTGKLRGESGIQHLAQ